MCLHIVGKTRLVALFRFLLVKILIIHEVRELRSNADEIRLPTFPEKCYCYEAFSDVNQIHLEVGNSQQHDPGFFIVIEIRA